MAARKIPLNRKAPKSKIFEKISKNIKPNRFEIPPISRKADRGDIFMAKHYNLYYLLLEDQKNNPMSEEANRKILDAIESHYREGKPPWHGHNTDPPEEGKEKSEKISKS